MKRSNPASIVLVACLLLSVSCRTVPDEQGTFKGRPVHARASHPAGAALSKARGTWLGRRYFTPPGSKSGLQWIDVYAD